MIKIHELPDWFPAAADLRKEDSPDNMIPVISVAYERDGDFYFDGLVAAMLGQNKIPLTIEIALDAEDMGCIVRLNYGDEEDSSALYAPFEIESFALLWNANPKWIHGIQGNRVTLSMKHADTRYSFINGAGITSFLWVKDGVFVAQPDPEFADEWAEAA